MCGVRLSIATGRWHSTCRLDSGRGADTSREARSSRSRTDEGSRAALGDQALLGRTLSGVLPREAAVSVSAFDRVVAVDASHYLLTPRVVVAVSAGAAAQIITGTGFALVCAPFLLLMLGHDVGVRAVLMLSLALNAYLLAVTFRHARWRDSLLLLLPAALLVIHTVFIVDVIRVPALTIAAGVVILLATGLVAKGRTLKMIGSAGGVVLVGALAASLQSLPQSADPQ